MPLYISMTTPSSELDQSPIDEAITFFASQVAIERRNGNFPSEGPALDITFMLSTQKDTPPFNGMRMGGYTKENNTLYFETAVPTRVSQSSFAARYVAAALQDAVEYATQYFEEYNVDFDAAHWHEAVKRLASLETAGQKVH